MAEPIDFDAWLAENAREPIKFKLLDKEWELPGDIPAVVQLRLDRIERFVMTAVVDPDSELPADISAEEITYESLTRMMIGNAMVDEWLSLGLGYEQLQSITRRLMQIYRGGGDGAGKAPRPRKKKRKKRPQLEQPPELPQTT